MLSSEALARIAHAEKLELRAPLVEELFASLAAAAAVSVDELKDELNADEERAESVAQLAMRLTALDHVLRRLAG